jgi:ABC-type Zn uptake system ZnuABC Zn-binding protein ZnuA
MKLARIWLAAGLLAVAAARGADRPPPRVVCTTFPVWHITRNIARGREGAGIRLLLPPGLGCPHDYVLAPQDAAMLDRADVLVINGLGLEDFLHARLAERRAGRTVINGSRGIEPLPARGGHRYHAPPGAAQEAVRHGDEEEHPDPAENGNPHVFASPRLNARMAENIARELAKTDPDGEPTYAANARNYAGRMERLAGEFAALGRSLRNRRIVTQHDVFDYLARDAGLEVVAVIQDHPGQEPSAAGMLAIAEVIRAKGVGAVFAEPQYPAQVAETLARESGVPMAMLDPAATGPADAPLDYYDTIMRRNLDALRSALGEH